VLDVPTEVPEQVEEVRMNGEYFPKRIVRPRVVTADAFEGEVETVADQVVCVPRRWLMDCCRFPCARVGTGKTRKAPTVQARS
jgi:hypothetical protein